MGQHRRELGHEYGQGHHPERTGCHSPPLHEEVEDDDKTTQAGDYDNERRNPNRSGVGGLQAVAQQHVYDLDCGDGLPEHVARHQQEAT